jgi:uncharacterized protein (TIGR02266 family)
VTARASLPGQDPVRGAREHLAQALRAVQSIAGRPQDLDSALEHLAAASSALFSAESEATSEASALGHLRAALDELTRALDLIHARPKFVPGLDTIASEVAQALALLFPRVRASERQRRSVLASEALPTAARTGAAAVPPQALGAADAPPRTERLVTGRAGEVPRTARLAEQRTAGHRVRIEVDVGLLSDSNFYAGVAADVSAGGVFVSTAEPLPVGTEVTLYFTLDGGHTLQPNGTVRWTRPAGEGRSAGMGVGFGRLSEDDRRAIVDFCAQRPPLFHE